MQQFANERHRESLRASCPPMTAAIAATASRKAFCLSAGADFSQGYGGDTCLQGTPAKIRGQQACDPRTRFGNLLVQRREGGREFRDAGRSV